MGPAQHHVQLAAHHSRVLQRGPGADLRERVRQHHPRLGVRHPHHGLRLPVPRLSFANLLRVEAAI